MRQVSDDSQPATAQRSPRPTVSLSGWARGQSPGPRPMGLMADSKLQEAGRVMGVARSTRGKTAYKTFLCDAGGSANVRSAWPVMFFFH